MSTEKYQLAISDPTYIGPGVWYSIHLLAKEATDAEKIQRFIDYMYSLSDYFPCKKCRNHIQDYIDNHPFNDLKNFKNSDGTLIGMFKWSWLFHNAVNNRLGKPYMDWETAWDLYNNDITVCSQNCSGESDAPENEIKVSQAPVNDKYSKLAQGYFMKIGIPSTLKKHNMII